MEKFLFLYLSMKFEICLYSSIYKYDIRQMTITWIYYIAYRHNIILYYKSFLKV